MDVIHHRLAFDQLDAPLVTQLPQYPSNLLSQLAVEDLPSELGNDDHVVLAFPPHVRQTLPIIHGEVLLPGPKRPSQKGNLPLLPPQLDGSLEARRVARPEAVVLALNNTEPDANETAFAALQAVIAATEGTGKNPAAVLLGRKGGLKGGRARAEKLTKEQRTESARKAAQARWTKAKEN